MSPVDLVCMEPTNHPGISCEETRAMLSVAADGELSRDDEQLASLHVDDCAACADYADRVAVLTRRVRLRVAAPSPDFVDQVMARNEHRHLGRGRWLRPALAWCGAVIAIQSVAPLVFGELAGTPAHVARHVGASALALAIGFVYAAVRPHRAFGLLPLVAALFATTVVGAALDIISGRRAPQAEAVHIAELLGMVLLWLVAGSPGWERVSSGMRSVIPGRAAARSTS